MSFPCRLVLAAVMVFAAARSADAQTVIVRNAPPGAGVQVTFNNGSPVSAKADGYGDARLELPSGGRETDVQIHTDVCGAAVKVMVNEPGQPPGAEDAGCTRKDMWGVYILRAITTFVVEVNGNEASVFVAQGAPPPAWLQRGSQRITKLPWGEPGRGLTLSIGSGISAFGNVQTRLCGSTTCTSDDVGLLLHAAADFWFMTHVAVHAGYLRVGDVTATGSGATYRFETRRVARLATVGIKGGVPVGPARIYALGGLNRHEATETISETVDDRTVTVDGVNRTIAGGTQAFGQKTSGWSWMLGGGFELWTSKWVGVYAEFMRARLKGSPEGGGDGGLDEQGNFIAGGARIRLWR